MALTVTHQKIQDASPVHKLPVAGDYDPVKGIDATLLDTFYAPAGAAPVSVVDGSGADVDRDQVRDWILESISDGGSRGHEADLKSLARQCLSSFDHASTLRFDEFFPLQYGARYGLPQPSPVNVYSAGSDVVPVSKQVFSGASGFDELCVSIAYTFHPQTLAFGFRSESDFEEFKQWLTGEVSKVSSQVPAQAASMFGQFQSEKLDGLTASIVLRDENDPGAEEFGFARLLVHLLMEYHSVAAPEAFGVMPFLLSELYNPSTLVFVNVERHARSHPAKVAQEWHLIDQAIKQPILPLSSKKLRQLTSMHRNAAKAAGSMANAANGKETARARELKFRKTPPSTVDLFKPITRILSRMKQVNMSMNAINTKVPSFSYANRRNPNDVNLPGKSVSKKYIPDIHVYLDNSGSISEMNYQQSMKMLFKLARKLGVDIYFTSFSDEISTDYRIPVKGRSMASIWRSFRSVPKVTGGTDFTLVWRHIQSSKARRRRFNLMITDFGFESPSYRFDHPKNLYYAPCSNMDWGIMTSWAREFAESSQHIEPKIQRRFIGMR